MLTFINIITAIAIVYPLILYKHSKIEGEDLAVWLFWSIVITGLVGYGFLASAVTVDHKTVDVQPKEIESVKLDGQTLIKYKPTGRVFWYNDETIHQNIADGVDVELVYEKAYNSYEYRLKAEDSLYVSPSDSL